MSPELCLLWYRMEQQRFESEMTKLQQQLEAKEAQMQRVASGTSQVSALKQHYDRVLSDLAGERDQLQADRSRLLQVCCLSLQLLYTAFAEIAYTLLQI